MIGLRSDYLSELSKYCLTDFVEVIPYDYFKNYKLKPKNQFILNLSHSSSGGSHYIAIVIQKDCSTYFDSFGMSCENLEITKHLKKRKKPIINSNIQIQDFSSIFCGYFCLAYLIYDQNQYELEKFISMFDEKNLLQNDKKCIKIITSHIQNNFV